MCKCADYSSYMLVKRHEFMARLLLSSVYGITNVFAVKMLLVWSLARQEMLSLLD